MRFQQAGSKSFIFFLILRWAPLPNQSCKILKLWQLCKLTFCPSTPSNHSHMCCCIDKDRLNWAAVTVVLERKPHTSDIMDTNIVWQNLDNPTSSANWVHENCEEMDDGSLFLASQEKKRCSGNFEEFLLEDGSFGLRFEILVWGFVCFIYGLLQLLSGPTKWKHTTQIVGGGEELRRCCCLPKNIHSWCCKWGEENRQLWWVNKAAITISPVSLLSFSLGHNDHQSKNQKRRCVTTQNFQDSSKLSKLREILRNYHSFLPELFKSTTRISYFIAYPKKEEGDDDDEENLCDKEATFKGKDFIQDSGGHHKLEGPIPKLDSAHHKKSKSHL